MRHQSHPLRPNHGLFAPTLAAIRIHLGQSGRFSLPLFASTSSTDTCPSPKAPATIVAPLVRCADLAMWDGHAVALTGWLEAEQAELTVLHRSEEDIVTATAYRFSSPAGRLGAHRPARPSARRLKPRRH